MARITQGRTYCEFDQPRTLRVQLKEPIGGYGIVETESIDSTAIKRYRYNVRTKKLHVVFVGRKDYLEYTYSDVPCSVVHQLFDATRARRVMLPSRKDSVGATFRQIILAEGYDYVKRYIR